MAQEEEREGGRKRGGREGGREGGRGQGRERMEGKEQENSSYQAGVLEQLHHSVCKHLYSRAPPTHSELQYTMHGVCMTKHLTMYTRYDHHTPFHHTCICWLLLAAKIFKDLHLEAEVVEEVAGWLG